MSPKISINDFKLPLLEDYVRSHILVFLNRPGDSFSLQPTTLGNHNAIFLLFIDRFPSLILKGYPKINWYKKALNGSRLLAQHGIRVPRLYYTDSSEACFKTFGCHFICEEKIAGKSLAECGAIKDYIPAVAHCYAKMHQIRNSRWKDFFPMYRPWYKSALLKKVTNLLQSLGHSASQEITEKDLASYRSWFFERKNTLPNIQSQSLCHGDVNKKNILISDDNEIVLIDHETVKFSPFPVEFARLKLTLCEDRQDLIDLFETSYSAHCTGEALCELTESKDFYSAYVLLEFAVYFSRKLRQSADETARNYCAAQLDKLLSALEEIIK